ncbi:Fusaric acid resistance protein-like-domain-containing protein [Usnea florida]
MKQAWNFANSKTGRGVFKCSVAYLIGSMATFVPVIAGTLGKQDGKHMVATITVYFHPARSKGSMVEAMICAVLAFAYAVFISFSSMGVSILFGRTLDMLVLGHIVVLIVFCGGGLGFVGWTKQRLGHPLVNISCSLTSLAIITVLTKEGAVQAAEFSDDKVTQVMIMILMGVFATTAVSFVIWPVSARDELREGLIQVTDSFGDLLAMITRGFLTGSEEELQQQSFRDASDRYKKVFNSLTKNLKEAKYEHYVLGTEKEYQLEAKLVNCIQRLAQNVGGLRSAATTQFLLISQSTASGSATPASATNAPTPKFGYFAPVSSSLMSPSEEHGVLAAIDESPGDTSWEVTAHPFEENGSIHSITSPSDIFAKFVIQLGPSMKSLAVTLKKLLDELPYAPDGSIAVNAHFRTSLDDAIDLYKSSREEALSQLYKTKALTRPSPIEMEADFEEVAASCGYFSFSLLDFAIEMRAYVEILDDLKLEVEERPDGKTWNWLRVWRKMSESKRGQHHNDPERESLIAQNEENDIPRDVPSPSERKATGELASPREGPKWSYGYRLWRALSVFRRDDVKFAVKVGIGAALYALPSFLAATRPLYQHWRGEWGLLSYMLVCAMTIGASNTTGFARFFGTCIGAVCAIVSWIVSAGNAVLLAFFGWLMALWTAYIIVAQGRGPMGRFIMLTYNLSALYAYSLSVQEVDGDDDEGGNTPIITEIVLHRVVAVLSGCLWGLIVTRLVWPISAREKFKDGLSVLWLRMGLVWKRDPLATLTEGESPNAYMDLREEFELQRYLMRLENLKSSAASEVDLRGPFPDTAFSRILKSTDAMLDAFHAMNVMIMKDPKATKAEARALEYTVKERTYLSTRISHLFQVLASSMKLEYPLNEALPNIDNARDRLLAKIFRFRKEEKDATDVTDQDFELLYAYALVTGQLSKEITTVGTEIEQLFGVLNEELLQLQ